MSDGFHTIFAWHGDPAMQDEMQRRDTYRRCFSTLHGRQVLADILIAGGCVTPAWLPGSSQEEALQNTGAHAFALSIAQLAGLDLSSFGKALIEGELETMMTSEEPQDDD